MTVQLFKKKNSPLVFDFVDGQKKSLGQTFLLVPYVYSKL